MLQAENGRQQATAELAAREQALADARTKVERVRRNEADDRAQPATAEPAERVDHVEAADAGDHSLLKVGCAVAGLAGIGLVTATMLALTVDTLHVTTAGIIGAISGGAMLAVMWVAFVANWYRKRIMPVQDETPATSKGSRSRRTS